MNNKKYIRERRFFKINHKCFRYLGCQCHLRHKDCRFNLGFIFIANTINFRTHDFTCSLIYHHVIINYFVLQVTVPGQLPYYIFKKFFSMHSFIYYLLLLSLIQTFCIFRAIYTKNVLFILNNGAFDVFVVFDLFQTLNFNGVYSTPLLFVTTSAMFSFIFLLTPNYVTKDLSS